MRSPSIWERYHNKECRHSSRGKSTRSAVISTLEGQRALSHQRLVGVWLLTSTKGTSGRMRRAGRYAGGNAGLGRVWVGASLLVTPVRSLLRGARAAAGFSSWR
jgi:hypothetical protein